MNLYLLFAINWPVWVEYVMHTKGPNNNNPKSKNNKLHHYGMEEKVTPDHRHIAA
jgi:hypothetical protein